VTDAHWEQLGIAPTDDTRAIRRAYAQLLKAIDVEREPKAFIALREAYDRVLAEALQTPIEVTVAEPLSLRERAEMALTRLELALIERPAEIAAALDALLDPALVADIDANLAVEERLAALLLGTAPRSTPLLGRVIAAFGWDLRDLDSPVVDQLNQQHRIALAAARHQAKPDPILALLRAPFEPPSPGEARQLSREVLAWLEHADRHPHRLADVDPEARAWWEAHADRPQLWIEALKIAGWAALFAAAALLLDPHIALARWFGVLAGAALVATGLSALRLCLHCDHPAGSRLAVYESIALLLLLLLPGAALFARASLGAAAGAGLIGAVLMLAIAEPAQGPDEADRVRRMLTPCLAPLLWLVLTWLQAPGIVVIGAIAITFAAIGSFRAFDRVQQALAGSEGLRRAAALAVALPGLIVLGLLLAAPAQALLVPLAVAAALLVLPQHLFILGDRREMMTSAGTWVITGALLATPALFPSEETPWAPRWLPMLVCALIVFRALRSLVPPVGGRLI
jgi:hypothetical protein